jgi:hypothetical protein
MARGTQAYGHNCIDAMAAAACFALPAASELLGRGSGLASPSVWGAM